MKRVEEFRSEFLQSLPFHVEDSGEHVVNKAYESISIYHDKTLAYEEEATELSNLGSLFGL